MGNISAFMHVSIDGYFARSDGATDWFKSQQDPEFNSFLGAQSRSDSTLIFGRRTYEMMESYWPTEDARRNDPDMATVMSDSPKIVISRTLASVQESPHWKSVELWREINVDALRKAKEVDDRNFTILGSGTIVQQFARLGLLDELQLAVNPVILGSGKSALTDVDATAEPCEARSFTGGMVWLRYRLAADS